MKKFIISLIIITTLFMMGSCTYATSDFYITDIDNITDHCNYTTGYTYDCSRNFTTGAVWDNIIVNGSINLPNNHGNYGADSTSISFECNNEFYMVGDLVTTGSRYGCRDNDAGGDGGSISIKADEIYVNGSFRTYGAYCDSDSDDDCPSCDPGSAGSVTIASNNFTIDKILAYGAEAREENGGNGGNVNIISRYAKISYIHAKGGKCTWKRDGGRGGIIDLEIDYLDMGNIYAYGGHGDDGGYGGSITIASKELDVGHLYTYGGHGYDNDYGDGRAAGDIDIVSETATIGDINSYGGRGYDSSGGDAGNVNLDIDALSLGLINIYGGNGDHRRGGHGGSLIINSDSISSIGSINANAGGTDYSYSGASGGEIKIITKEDLLLESISCNGGSGGRGRSEGDPGAKGGNGGTIDINTEGIIQTNGYLRSNGGSGGRGDGDGGHGGDGGPGGQVKLTSNILNMSDSIYALGGRGGPPDDKYKRGGEGGPGGKIRISSETILGNTGLYANGGNGGSASTQQTGGDGGPAGIISIYTDDDDIDLFLQAKGGAGDFADDWGSYCHCGDGGDGGMASIFIDEDVQLPDFNIDISGGDSPDNSLCDGTCGYDGNLGQANIQNRTVYAGFRAKALIDEISTNNDFIGSLRIRIKDPSNGRYTPSMKTYSVWSGLNSISNGELNYLFGLGDNLPITLGKKYVLEMTLSSDTSFNEGNCILGTATCDLYEHEFQYYYGA